MISIKHVILGLAMAVIIFVEVNRAESDSLDENGVALTYHKITGEPLDIRRAAEATEAVRRASSLDKPDVMSTQIARLQVLLADANPAKEFVIRVNDSVSDYDKKRGEFSINLFKPGYYVPIRALQQQYQLVFVNAASARAIPMAKEEATMFDARLDAINRQVVDELHFRVIGKGDPTGTVTGTHVIRAEIVSAQLLDQAGRLLYTPHVAPSQDLVAGADSHFDMASADVSGFHVGVGGKDLQAALIRLFGSATHTETNKDKSSPFAGTVTFNPSGCAISPARQTSVGAGSVCITAYLDQHDIVRAVRVERIFPWFDADILRKALQRKYGVATSTRDVEVEGRFSLGWGPEVAPGVLYNQSGLHNAFTAYYDPMDDFTSEGANRLPDIHVVLQLVDAKWASQLH